MGSIIEKLNETQKIEKNNHNKTVSISLKVAEIEKLKKVAKKYNISLSGLIALIIREDDMFKDNEKTSFDFSLRS